VFAVVTTKPVRTASASTGHTILASGHHRPFASASTACRGQCSTVLWVRSKPGTCWLRVECYNHYASEQEPQTDKAKW